MWGSVLGLAFLAALNLVRLGLTLLVISRPRPVLNLLAFSAGCLTGAIPVVAIPLTLLHATSIFTSFTQGATIPATNSTIRHVQLGMGVLALSLAAVVALRALTRRRRQAQLLSEGTLRGRHRKRATSTLTPDLSAPTANTAVLSRPQGAPIGAGSPFGRLLSQARDAPAEGGSAFRRLLHRAHSAWENGSLWVAYAVGVIFGGPPPGEAFFLFAIVATSSTAVGTQVLATVVYLAGMLAVTEIVLVCYAAAPARTHALLGRLHDWTRAHRQRVLVAIFIVVGVALLARSI